MEQSGNHKKLYTTHEVARLLGVTPITVIRWIEGGRFKCYTTVGGHRRIDHSELAKFAQTYNLPWRGDEELKSRKEFVVLGVDDEPDVLDLFQDILDSISGIQFIGVSSGFLAAAKLVEDRPDLVLLDFMMPELDGFEFCRFARQDPRFKELPIIAVTGLKGEIEQMRMREAGVNEILVKPFSHDLFVGKIEHFQRRQKKTEEGPSDASGG